MGTIQSATRHLPDHSELIFSLHLFRHKRLFWLLQIPATLLFFLFGGLFIWYTFKVRPDLAQAASEGIRLTPWGLLAVLAAVVVSITLHELIHGLFFWIFTRARPTFGFRGGYAFAGAPGWFFPRWQYIVIGLAPFVLLSLLGLFLLAVVPRGALAAVLFGVVMNAAGAVGDLWIVLLLLRQRQTVWVEDLGDGFNFYAVS